jgi:hypothetical protein
VGVFDGDSRARIGPPVPAPVAGELFEQPPAVD